MNYEYCKKFLSKGRDKDSRRVPSIRYTWVETRDNNAIALRYHSTDVVTFLPNGDLILNSGDYHTVTTKSRINNIINALPGCPGVYRQKFIWYISGGNISRTVFEDDMIITADGTLVGTTALDRFVSEEDKPTFEYTEAKIKAKHKKLSKLIKTYIDGFKEDIKVNGLGEPGASGDCFACVAYDGAKDPVQDNPVHILSHLKEKYFVPMLLWNAICDYGYRDTSYIYREIQRTNSVWIIDRTLLNFFNKRRSALLNLI